MHFRVTLDGDRALDEIGIPGHKLDSLCLGRRLALEAMLPIGGRARIEKFGYVSTADQCLELGFAQRLFTEIALPQLASEVSQETSCFATCRSGGFVVKDDRLLGHRPPLLRYFTTITGTGAFRTTSLPVSPMVTRRAPLSPREPMRIRSH
jgi:hypothetical protein